MSRTEAQMRAEEKYKKNKKRISVQFTKEEFEALQEHTKGINRVNYIKTLIKTRIHGESSK